jgi:hypothetical protein
VTTATQEFKKERKKYIVDPKVLFMDFPCTSYITMAGIAKLCPKNDRALSKWFWLKI